MEKGILELARLLRERSRWETLRLSLPYVPGSRPQKRFTPPFWTRTEHRKNTSQLTKMTNYVTSALVKHLHGVGGDGDPVADMQITGQDRVDVGCELGALVIVHGMGNVVVGTLDLDHLLARRLVIAASLAQL